VTNAEGNDEAIETRTVHDPFLGKNVEISHRLVDRLRGRYAVGPTMPNGEPEFGWRQHEVPPIQKEAAAVIERLHKLYALAVEGRSQFREALREARAEAEDLQALFDLQWEADQRAIKRWQDAHPSNDNVWPDRTDMVVWLMEQHAASSDYERGRRDLAREVFALHEHTVEIPRGS
jgi:hypothetical protein